MGALIGLAVAARAGAQAVPRDTTARADSSARADTTHAPTDSLRAPADTDSVR